MRMPDEDLETIAPILARAQREDPSPRLEVVLAQLLVVARRRGLKRIAAELESAQPRVAA